MRLLKVFSTNIFVLMAVLLAIHVALNIFGSTSEVEAVGDVVNVYKPWVDAIGPQTKWLGVAQPWVYPFVAWAPIIVARWLIPFDYLQSWMLLATLLNLVAVGQLVRWGRRTQAFAAAWFYLAFVALLGPVAITRLDGISVSLAIIGIASLLRASDQIASRIDATRFALVWFTIAAWIKVWPVALVLSVLQKGAALRAQILVIGATCLVILGLGVVLGGDANLFSFVTTQTDRGLQVESPIAFIWVAMATAGAAHSIVYFDTPLMTYQVSGDGVAIVSSLMSLVQFGAVAITAFLMWRASKTNVRLNQIMVLTALTATLDLIVFNKVGSPQYQLWLAAPVVLGLALGLPKWRVPTIAVLMLALLTHQVYPLHYNEMLTLQPYAVALLGLRNLILIALLVWSNLALGKLAKPVLGDRFSSSEALAGKAKRD